MNHGRIKMTHAIFEETSLAGIKKVNTGIRDLVPIAFQ